MGESDPTKKRKLPIKGSIQRAPVCAFARGQEDDTAIEDHCAEK